MGERPGLATGHARTANARNRIRCGWTEVARLLNSDGNGCVKDWKQWAKYWKDKKAAVKRKASQAEAIRRRTGGGIEEEVVELTDIEQRILTIAGGLSFATGDRHLTINPFPEQASDPNPEPTAGGSGQSESILLQAIPGPSGLILRNPEESAQQWDETAMAVVGEGSAPLVLESPAQQGDEVESDNGVNDDEDVTVSSENEDIFEDSIGRENPPVSTVRARRRTLVSTPSQRRRVLPAQPSGSQLRRRRGGRGSAHVSPRGAAGARGTVRRRLLRLSPPSQRRSEMASLTERFVAIEERRVDAEQTMARAMQRYSEGFDTLVGAIDRFTNTIDMAAKQIIEGLRHQGPPNI